LPDNPAVGIDLLKEKKGTRFLSTDEMRRIIGALQAEEDVLWRTYFMPALMLGSRRNELLSIRWADVDFEQQMLRLPETKSGREHILPLPGPALELLKTLPRQNDFIFAGNGETGHRINVKRAWKRICKQAGVTSCRVHDLRHTVGSWLSMGRKSACRCRSLSRERVRFRIAECQKSLYLSLWINHVDLESQLKEPRLAGARFQSPCGSPSIPSVLSSDHFSIHTVT
jgi:integrase